MSKQKNKADVYDLPQIKREQVGRKIRDKFKVRDEKGKVHKVAGENWTDKEIESTHLIKIAPFYYFCPDNYKVLMIPFSLEMTAEMFLNQTAKQAVNFDEVIKKSEAWLESMKEAQNAKKKEKSKGE